MMKRSNPRDANAGTGHLVSTIEGDQHGGQALRNTESQSNPAYDARRPISPAGTTTVFIVSRDG